VLIEYESESVRKIFNDYELMKKESGNDRARATKKRIDQLKASETFSIYLTTGLGKPHPLYENLKGYYGVTITGNVRLIVRPNAESIEPEVLKQCESVIIKGVMDYHGSKNEWLIP
jgi:Txe/YoeB family toxin of Txe-Axe toxin-antitoxin module